MEIDLPCELRGAMNGLKGEYVNWFKDTMLGDSAANGGMVSGRMGCDWNTAIEEIAAYLEAIPTLEYRFTEVDQTSPDGSTTHSVINLMSHARDRINKRRRDGESGATSWARVA